MFKRLLPIFLYAGFSLCMYNTAKGQTFLFRHYKTEDGLSYNSVNCSLQDSKGFLWFGTLNGLNRYDGHNFKVFRKQSGEKNTLGNNFISALYDDKHNSLWVGTHNGLYQYSSLTESFELIDFTNTKWIAGITSDKKGNLWFIINGNICCYNPVKKSAHTFRNNDAHSIICDEEGDIWTNDIEGKIWKYDLKQNMFISFNMFAHSSFVANKQIEKIYNTENHSLLIGTSNQGLKLFNKITSTYEDILTRNPDSSGMHIRDIIKIDNDAYWIASNTGIYIYDSKKGIINHLTKNNLDANSLSDDNVMTLCKDNEGGIWASTYFAGINYYNRQNSLFERYLPSSIHDHLNTGIIGKMSEDNDGNLWISTDNDGIYYLNTKSERLEKRFDNYKSTSGILVSGNELWVGTGISGLDVINTKNGKLLRRYKRFSDVDSLKSSQAICLHKMRSGLIIAGTARGVFYYDSLSKEFQPIQSIPENIYVSSLLEDYNGNIWVGTLFAGAYVLDKRLQRGKQVKIDFSNFNRDNNSVTSICEDSKHNIWFSTESAGIIEYETVTGKHVHFTAKNGLLSNNTFKILEDNMHSLWISTSQGLIYFNVQKNLTCYFTTANGLLSNQFNYNSGYKTANGTLYFGSTDGLVSFNPKQFSFKSFHYPLYITGVQVNNQELSVNGNEEILQTSVLNACELKFPYWLSSFNIDFAALSYISPETIHYAYRLNGIDKNWTYLKTNQKAYFTKLPPGSYEFKVKAADNSGVWCAEKTLKIIITPPWWLSRWAYVVYLFILIISIYTVAIYYFKRMIEKNNRSYELLEIKKNKELYAAKIDFFTKVTHEIRTPLTLITASLEKIDTAGEIEVIKDNFNLINKHTNRLVTLTNQLLDFRKTENNDIQLNFVKTNVSRLIAETWLYFEVIAKQKNIAGNFKNTDEEIYAYVDVEALRKILSNLMHNAIKYAESTVCIALNDIAGNSFSVEISNDGPLIPYNLRSKIFEPFYRLDSSAQYEGTGIGLALTQSLVELHKGKIIVGQSETHNVFIVTLPKTHEKQFDLESNNTISSNIIQQQKQNVAILLVEDNYDIQHFLRKELSNDYILFQALNGEQAIDILHKEEIKLVISDIMMPLMDGFELCLNIKNTVTTSHIPVILLSAKNAVTTKITGLETGADVYIEKPFSPAYLKAQVASLLTNRMKVQQFFSNSPLAGIATLASTTKDVEFLNKVDELIIENIQNVDLDVDFLASSLNMSRRTLFRKVKAVSEISVSEMINLLRLKRAAELLANSDLRVYEVADQTGFTSSSVFIRSFTKQFGISPAEFSKKKR